MGFDHPADTPRCPIDGSRAFMSDSSPLTQRDIEALRTTLDKLDRTVTDLPDRMDRIYVRKDVQDKQNDLVATALTTIHETLQKHSGWFDWIVRSVGLIIIAGLVTMLFASGGIHHG